MKEKLANDLQSFLSVKKRRICQNQTQGLKSTDSETQTDG